MSNLHISKVVDTGLSEYSRQNGNDWVTVNCIWENILNEIRVKTSLEQNDNISYFPICLYFGSIKYT